MSVSHLHRARILRLRSLPSPLTRTIRRLSFFAQGVRGVGGGVIMRFALCVMGALLMGAASAQADSRIYHANDTGGIISWSCDNEADAKEIAAAYCARWDKYPRITSVHR